MVTGVRTQTAPACGMPNGEQRRVKSGSCPPDAEGMRARLTCMRQSGEQYKTDVTHRLYITANGGCGWGRRVSISSMEKE